VCVGRGTALFVCGTCFCPESPVASLELLVDGEPQPVGAHSMPRLDFFASLHPQLDPYATPGLTSDPRSDGDPLLLSYRSGFWGLARIPPRTEDGDCELELRALLEDGRTVHAPLAHLRSLAARGQSAAGGRTPEVAICMATYDPPAELFRRQVDSIRAQTHQNWICYVSDDHSSAGAFEVIERTVDGDPRFVVSRSGERRGFYGNFERALSMAPRGARFVAMADQDDYWQPDKLQTSIERIGDAQLVYSDARIVARDGRLISDTYWSSRRNNHSDLTSLLVANSVTGAASLFRSELLDYALPFPPAQFAHFHDHWIALTALALGKIEFVDRPLYDYVQHGDAWLGHATANRVRTLGDRLGSLRTRSPRERARKWRMHYFVDIARLMQVAAVLELRGGELIPSGKRQVLRRFARADDSLPTLSRLLMRGARELVGQQETLGAEWMLLLALVWRRALEASLRPRPQRVLRLDAVPPPSLAPAPDRSELSGVVREVAEKIAPLDLRVSEQAPARVNLLIPTIDLKHFFGGYIAKLNLARRLAERGLRVRLVATDPVAALPPGWKRTLESYSGLRGLFEHVEVAFGRGGQPLEVSPDDSFIATTWWTAHIAASAVKTLEGRRFVYLIQEYEPFTFPMGSYAALAAESYKFEHFALFSSEFLREYFRQHRLGVFAGGPETGERTSASFQNAITAVGAPTVAELEARTSRRLLFYARPEQHAARNIFELGGIALARLAQDGLLYGWKVSGIGSVEPGRVIPLGGGSSIDLLPRSGQDEYGRLLREHDVGLALMYTPHPSLVPIEMAAAGLLTVTNTFENKTQAALASISSNLIAVEPSLDGIVAGLRAALEGADEFGRRAAGGAVNWSRSWEETFPAELLDKVLDALG
jgi:glycosyltransferase involved in cell wall biosynthesis